MIRIFNIALLLIVLQFSQLAGAAHDYDFDSHEHVGDYCEICLQLSSLNHCTFETASTPGSGALPTGVRNLPAPNCANAGSAPFDARAPPHSV